jgi:hypothetical protein
MVRFKVDAGKITDIEAIELGKRGDIKNLEGAILNS